MADDSENYEKHTNVICCQNAFLLVLKLVGVFFKTRYWKIERFCDSYFYVHFCVKLGRAIFKWFIPVVCDCNIKYQNIKKISGGYVKTQHFIMV